MPDRRKNRSPLGLLAGLFLLLILGFTDALDWQARAANPESFFAVILIVVGALALAYGAAFLCLTAVRALRR